MNTMITVPVRATGSRLIRQPAAVRCRIATRRSPLKRFACFIESTDWEERYLGNRWIDRVCLAVLAASATWFALFLTAPLGR